MGEMQKRRAAVEPYLAIGEAIVRDWVFGAQWLDAGAYPGAGEGVLALTDTRLLHVDDHTGDVIELSRWDVDSVFVTKANIPLMRVAHIRDAEASWSFIVSRSTAKTIDRWFRTRPSQPPAVLPTSASGSDESHSLSPTTHSATLYTKCYLEGVTPGHPRGPGQVSASQEGLLFSLDSAEVRLRWEDLEHFKAATDLDGERALMVRSKVGTGSYVALISADDLEPWRERLRGEGVAQR